MNTKKYFLEILIFLAFLCLMILTRHAHAAVPTMDFTVNMSKAVNVDITGGTPRIAVDVGGNTRYASYASGTGTSTLIFTYTATAGDVDLDGVAVSSPVDLNGGTITDLAGNALTNLTFTPPTTTGVKVDYPSLSMDFTNGSTGRYTLNGTAYTTLSSFLTAAGTSFTRASTATYFDSSGTLQTAATNTPRFDYDPSTLAFRGLLMERSRTNSIRNSTMTGAVAGSPGTAPTNWSVSNITGAGLSYEIVSTGTSNGIPYIDIRVFGTASSAFPVIYFESATQIAALTGQSWTVSGFIQHISGSMTNINSINFRIVERTSAAGIVITNESAMTVPTSGILSSSRLIKSFTFSGGATTAYAHPGIRLNVNVATSVDITLRIGGVQLEQGLFATSYITTTNAAVARQNEFMNIPTGSWYNQSAGGFYSYTEWASSTGASFPMLARFDDTGNNNRWNIYYSQGANTIGVSGHNGGVTQGSFSSATQSTSGSIKGAAAQGTNTANAAYNGTLSTLDTVWSPPTVTQWTTDATNARIWTKNFKYYPLRITDTQLQLLTQ